MKSSRLYHLISSRDIPGVLRCGLTPHKGDNSSSIDENRDAVFLCEERDIEYWQIMLNDKTDVLAVDISDIPESCICEFRYSCYGEYAVECSIPPARIKYLRPLDKTSPEYENAIVDLCESHLASISWFALMCARHYSVTGARTEPCLEYIMQAGLGLEIVLPRLDYGIRPQKRWESWLREYGADGEYTFCDFHDNTQTKLYQKLVEYPDDESSEYRSFVYEYVRKTFPWAETLDTGGWADYRAIAAQGRNSPEMPQTRKD